MISLSLRGMAQATEIAERISEFVDVMNEHGVNAPEVLDFLDQHYKIEGDFLRLALHARHLKIQYLKEAGELDD